jgi:hypothetical protein
MEYRVVYKTRSGFQQAWEDYGSDRAKAERDCSAYRSDRQIDYARVESRTVTFSDWKEIEVADE